MDQPIVIPMEDELVHTQERPYCNDPLCPCHTAAQENGAGSPRKKHASRRRRGARRKQKGFSRRAENLDKAGSPSL
jgi:hypothetical protein